MAFYKKFQSKTNDLWYPKAVTTGKPVSTDKVADRLALLSTVTRGDTYAVLKNFGGVLADYMAQGRSVKIEGVGTFYYTISANKRGVATAGEVSAAQIRGVRVRFIPEVGRNSSNQVVTRSMVDTDIPWTDVEDLAGMATTAGGTGSDNSGTGSTDGGGSTGGGTTGGEDGDNPIG